MVRWWYGIPAKGKAPSAWIGVFAKHLVGAESMFVVVMVGPWCTCDVMLSYPLRQL